ncbi:hypothetical protein Q9295_07250 [Xinfangfangia sp. CPCC 101601]|uniref:Uncharacterized protein n=1 Tax=Pseudogemmobacter lacusdianii TaxID=3069608 RepID=A0ABU0VWP4_9RHOB|nr:hypothetical protein [Xinfangfangia sp. CPCC 101601]MDQ2066162.1 hypothetical protein [Xinfangfangia sp. CPCC 101601]
MRALLSPAFALASLMLAGTSLAEPSALSAEIGSSGLKATETRLAALPDPAPPELFALAGVRFLSGVEAALQLRWQTDLQADWSELPILRLPIPQNPDARAFTGADLNTLMSGVDGQMEAARAALSTLGEQQFQLEIALKDLWFDINMNGIRDAGESVAQIAGLTLGLGGFGGTEMVDPAIRFDTADAAWLTAYTHLLSAVVHVAQAYDPAAAVDRVTKANEKIAEFHGTTPFNTAFDMMFGNQVDRVAIILHALASAPDQALAASAHAHLLAVIRENRRFWALVEIETDNDHEWIPNDRQASGLGLPVPQGLGAHWQEVLLDGEKILKGELLLPHWRYGAEAGIDVAKLFQEPPAVDLIGMIQGEAFLPYVRKGPQASAQSWREFERLVMGDSMLFAIFLN